MKIAVFTATRAEYGLLKPIIQRIAKSSQLTLQLIVGGTHLLKKYGSTYQQIIRDGFTIDAKLDFLQASNDRAAIVRSMGIASMQMADTLSVLQPDKLVLLGDRFEALVAAQAAMIMQIPIVHLHGGEITEGAFDDAIRHAISKMAHQHCVATEVYANRLIQMGEQPSSVHNTGAVGVELFKQQVPVMRDKLSEQLNMPTTKPYALVTYHPVTAATEDPSEVIENLCELVKTNAQLNWLITLPNSDPGSEVIIDRLNLLAQETDNTYLRESLGALYFSAVHHAKFAMGNSSSGIIEIASTNTPVINIGERQKGRIVSPSVYNTSVEISAVQKVIDKLLDESFSYAPAPNPYDGKGCADKILNVISTPVIACGKSFYDLPGL